MRLYSNFSITLRLDLNNRPLLHLGHCIDGLREVRTTKAYIRLIGISVRNFIVPVDAFAVGITR
jgi:hypothetical protein